ncbi:MAG TPA: PDZ domain-containing protein, partial [Oscillospiraceae bacterium]|nr:PDZ domain-containing protein [Oscillospiraceae bacterium]
MGRKISLGAALTITIIAATLVFSVTMVFSIRNFNNKVSSIIEREGMYEKFTEIDTYVRQNYSGDIDETALMDAVAQGYLAGINDKYADYLSAEEYAEYIKAETGTVSGVGISVAMESSGYMQVTQVYEGSAASGAGIQPGDLIIKIDDI